MGKRIGVVDKDRLEQMIAREIQCYDCGSSVSDHERTDDFCNYEACWERVDDILDYIGGGDRANLAFGTWCDNHHLMKQEDVMCRRCRNEEITKAAKKKREAATATLSPQPRPRPAAGTDVKGEL
jgi:hypothetical protein